MNLELKGSHYLSVTYTKSPKFSRVLWLLTAPMSFATRKGCFCVETDSFGMFVEVCLNVECIAFSDFFWNFCRGLSSVMFIVVHASPWLWTLQECHKASLWTPVIQHQEPMKYLNWTEYASQWYDPTTCFSFVWKMSCTSCEAAGHIAGIFEFCTQLIL